VCLRLGISGALLTLIDCRGWQEAFPGEKRSGEKKNVRILFVY
jgi:hypothetical protein